MSEKIIKDQEETKEETKIGSEEIVKNGETKTGSEEIVKNEEKEVPEKVDANSSFWSKVKHFLKYSIQTWIARCFLIAFGPGASHGDIGKAVACTWCEVYGVFANRIFV